MKGKIVTLSIAASLVAVAGSAATLSYFTDKTDLIKNTFTVGVVKGEVYESQNYTVSTDNEANIIADDLTYADFISENCQLLPGISCAKNPFAKNTGNVPAYVELDVYYPYELYRYSIDTKDENGHTIKGVDVIDRGFNCVASGACDNEWKSKNFTRTIDGTEYFVQSFRRYEALEAGEMTTNAVIKRFGLTNDATQEQIEAAKASGAINADGSIDVFVQGYFVQQAGFNDVDDAFDAAYPELTWR